MNLIDKLFKKLGYVKIMKHIPIKEEKFKLELVRMEYEINPQDYINASDPSLLFAYIENDNMNKFLLSLAPFIEKRLYRGYPTRLHERDVERFELRIYVAKPPSNPEI